MHKGDPTDSARREAGANRAPQCFRNAQLNKRHSVCLGKSKIQCPVSEPAFCKMETFRDKSSGVGGQIYMIIHDVLKKLDSSDT